jgi:sulfoxide reductase heme-binding subunit YedZ
MAGAWRAKADRLCRHGSAKPLLALIVAGPLCWLVWAAFSNQLGANPAEALIRSTGDWTLRFLCVALAVTPMRQWLGMPVLARFRRMLGLTVFAYACLHLTAYVWLDMGAEWADVVADVAKRPFIALGMACWVLLLALALTSFNAAVRWMGAARWRALHRAVYAVAVLAVLHFWWMRAGKNNFTEVWEYATVLMALLSVRIWSFFGRNAASA